MRCRIFKRRDPTRLALIHFGVATDLPRHLDELRRRLDDWVARTEPGVTEEEFNESARADVDSGLEAYERAMPFWQSYAGLQRYWEKRRAA